jgi:glutathione S-transferase
MSLTFYYGSGSPYAWKVWLVLEHKAIAYDLRVLSFDRGDTKTPAYLALNPRGRVPTIVEDGFALWESSAIAEYLEERFPQQPLLPKDLKARATARRLSAEADGTFAPILNRLFDLTLYAEKPVTAGEIDEAHSRIQDELARLDAELKGPYLLGELSLADFAYFPHLRMLKRIDDRQPGKGIPDARLPAGLRAWKSRIEALPYYEKTIPPHWKA